MSISWKGGRAIRYYNNVRDGQNYFLHIFVILRPSLGFGILQCRGLILRHRMEFYADKTTWIRIFTSCYYYIFFIPESSVVLFSALAIFYFIRFTYYMTHSEKQSLISKHSLLGKDSTTPISQLQWSQSLRTTKKLHSTLNTLNLH